MLSSQHESYNSEYNSCNINKTKDIFIASDDANHVVHSYLRLFRLHRFALAGMVTQETHAAVCCRIQTDVEPDVVVICDALLCDDRAGTAAMWSRPVVLRRILSPGRRTTTMMAFVLVPMPMIVVDVRISSSVLMSLNVDGYWDRWRC